MPRCDALPERCDPGVAPVCSDCWLPTGSGFIASDARARAAATCGGIEEPVCSGLLDELARWLEEPRLRCEVSAAPALQRALTALAGANAQGSGFMVALAKARLSAADALAGG